MSMQIKKTTKSITLADSVAKQLEDMMQYFGHNASAMIQITISEYHGTKYRVQRFGQQKGAEKVLKKQSLIKDLDVFEKLSDNEATLFLMELPGFYKETELQEKEFIIYHDETTGERLRRIQNKNSSYHTDDPFSVVLAEYKKYLLINK